ncbi:transferrin receptor 1a [Osmerus eperlanus]|uniref:transferrin receptor 1a n=1 Tax=Osmerus eperlanus TaxID=29151 RepID=UPI002E148193
MDQARTTISKIFNGEPRSYTRFNLTQNMEGESSQVEMKLSSDMDEEGGNGVDDHLNHNGGSRDPYVVRKTSRTPKNLCFLLTTTLIIFIIGYLIGYLVHRKKEVANDCPAFLPSDQTVSDDEQVHVFETGAAPLMDWDVVNSLLAQKLSTESMEKTFGEFASSSHQAGSLGDEALGNRVLQRFRSAGLVTWTDEHFVTLQQLPEGATNRLAFKGRELGTPSGFLAYSRPGNVTGALVFASYGQVMDLKLLQDKGISLEGKILLVKTGKISFAEKVANAAQLKASAVLLFPGSAQNIGHDTQLYGHVHLGSGDPYTPGFPSFNHTQFPPVQSSGLPGILAQTITSSMAEQILRDLGGDPMPTEWGGVNSLGNSEDIVTLEVNNVLVQKRINNVFGLIKGFVEPDRFVVLGAQRDAWGPGFAQSTVGTSVLTELARSISAMMAEDGLKPRRSIVFASWSAGEYGSVGATEWLEGYLTSLSMKAFSYINLDGVVTGGGGFKASASPLMHKLLQSTLKEVTMGSDSSSTIYSKVAKTNWEASVLEPMRMDDCSYPFLTTSGIPSISFRFTANSEAYPFFGTLLDTREKLSSETSGQAPRLAVSAAQVAGLMTLRLVHDHLLRLDVDKYLSTLRMHVANINRRFYKVQKMDPSPLPKDMSVQWLSSALGSFARASRSLANDIQNSDMNDVGMCRSINDRIMQVERDFLSPYVCPRETPFRHILVGSAPHTLQALWAHLDSLKSRVPEADSDDFRVKFALATWTIQGCANGMAGNVWSIDNEI